MYAPAFIAMLRQVHSMPFRLWNCFGLFSCTRLHVTLPQFFHGQALTIKYNLTTFFPGLVYTVTCILTTFFWANFRLFI